jgi:RES domain-containing protein
MTPRRDRATGGRANPKGIPYLYLATNRKTALAEVRPVVGSLISVAQFRTNQTLNLVDCSSDHESSRIYLEEPEPEKREEAVWADINRAFSSPVTWSEDEADYVPTQIIAELFKSRGYGGIVYRSGLGDGHNVVFFDVDVAGLVNCSLFEADAVHFNFKQVANPYFAHSDSEN